MIKEKKTIELLIQIIHTDLQELYDAKNNACNRDFLLGQIYAYVECLEILQQCPSFRKMGLDYTIEDKFPLE